MGIMVRDRSPHEAALMEPRRADESAFCSEQLMPEPQLPCGWEKCLDLKSGLIYFKDWNSGTLTYRDPRRLATQRIGLMSISLSSSSSESKKPERSECAAHRLCTTDASPATASIMDDQSLELSLNLPGSTSTSSRPGTTSIQEGSVCTMEKVRSALERSQWMKLLPGRKRASSSRESTSSRLHLESSSPATSQSSSECFTSPSVMSYQGDDEEVQQPRECGNGGAKSQVLFGKRESGCVNPVMVTVGCKKCLMYVMLSKAHPSCPRCGNTDVLLELPAPLPKRQRIKLENPSWSWSTV